MSSRRIQLMVEYDLGLDAAYINGVEISDSSRLWDVFRRQGLFANSDLSSLHLGNADPRLKESLEEFLARGGEVTVSTRTARKRMKAIPLDDLDLDLE